METLEKFTLTSPDITDGASIAAHFEFNGFGCTGRNESPALHWSHAPIGTQSFAVTVYDPRRTHWIGLVALVCDRSPWGLHPPAPQRGR